MKKILSLLLILSMLFSFCACSKINALFSKNAEQSFSYPVSEMPKTLDPQIASMQSELIVIENCMEGLVRIGQTGEIIPAIAQSWDISADGLKYTFHLNRQAHWCFDEDDERDIKNFNKAITADDFVFAISRAVMKSTNAPDFQSVSLIKNANKIHASGSENTASLGVSAPNDYTLSITLESANSNFLTSLTNAVFMPCSRQFFDYCAGRYGRQTQYFLSNAGLKLRAWNETSIVMRKDENYSLSNPAKPDTVTLYRDENAFESFKNDNYDALAVGDDYIDEALADKQLNVQTFDDTVWSLGLNTQGELCQDKAFRQALFSGIEPSALSAPDWAEKTNSIVPAICLAGGKPYAQSIKAASKTYAPESAGEKFRLFSQQYFEKHDVDTLPTLRLLCTASFEKCAKQMAQAWQMNFGTGFNVKIDIVSAEDFEDTAALGKFDAMIFPLSADTSDAVVFFKRFCAENILNYRSSAYNRIFSAKQEEVKKCRACENTLYSDAVMYPLFASGSYFVQRNNVHGIYFYAFGAKVNFLNAERNQ